MTNLKRLSVDSDSWKKNSHGIKVNRFNDSFELQNGIQLFTWSAGLRECEKIGKTMADLDYLVHPVYSSLFEPSGYVNGIFDRPGIAENPHVAYCWS